MKKKKPVITGPKQRAREATATRIREGIYQKVDRRVRGKGEMAMPCVPSLVDHYLEGFKAIFVAFGKPFTAEELDHMRGLLREQLDEGFRTSPIAELRVRWETQPPPKRGIQYHIRYVVPSLSEQYDMWVANKKPPLFGKHPDQKLMHVAAGLGDPAATPVLDVGAGTGRNTLPLAKLGHPVDALEMTASFADIIRETAEKEKVADKVTIINADVHGADFSDKAGHYKVVVISEVLTHFRSVAQLRSLFERLATAMAPGGCVVCNAFVADEDYDLEQMVREYGEAVWAAVFTRQDFVAATRGLPFELASDESVLEYEKQHIPAADWPPTGWYVNWAMGRDLMTLPDDERPPLELRWFVFRRTD
jgi:SAM-dependent methyltransferase